MSRGSLSARDFEIPLNQQQVQYAQAPAQARGGAVEPIGEAPKNPIAVRQQKTQDYFNNYTALNNFVKNMSDQGIDVLDPSSGEAFHVAQKLQANLMFAANALGAEYEREKQIQPYLMTNKARYAQGFDPTSDLLVQNPNAVYSTEPLPSIEEANRRLDTPTYTSRDSSAFNKAYFDPGVSRIDQMIAAGQMTPEEGEYQKSVLQRNVPQTSYQQLIPRGGRRGLSQEDVFNRAELIKKIKGGIFANDPAPLNMFRLIPGVDDVEYQNTGNKVGINVYFKGSSTPSFVDLSQGSGENEINAFLNRIEGQLNVPNEAVAGFNTTIQVPQSNAGRVIGDIRNQLPSILSDQGNAGLLESIQELAATGQLSTPSGEPISGVEVAKPWLWGDTKLVVKYHPFKGNKIDYSRTKTMELTSEEVGQLVDSNPNAIGSFFGAGFEQGTAPSTAPAVVNKGGKKIF